MIAKTHRFHGRASLRFVYQNGRTVRGPLMALKFAANPRRRSYRLAVVVSRKVHKSAVTRNRIRRRLYEAVRRQAAGLSVYDMVITVYQEQVADLTSVELNRMVTQLLHDAGVYASKNSP